MTITVVNAGKPVSGKPLKLKGPIQATQSSTSYQKQTLITKVWDSVGKSWQNSDEMTYNYNANGMVSSALDQNWDGTKNQWFINNSDTFTYDAMNRQVIDISSTLDSLGKNLIYANKKTDSFSGNIKTETNYSWTGSWTAYSKDVIYLYNGLDTLDINEQVSGSSWVNVTEDEYKYNAKGQDSLDITSQWDGSAWQFSDKWQFYYDAHGNDTLYIHQHSMSPNFTQENKYIYNASNQITQVIIDSLNNGKSWPMADSTYAYDANGNDTQILVGSWDTASKGFDKYVYFSFTYTTLTGIGNINNSILKCEMYPNPMNKNTNLDVTTNTPLLARLNITDMSGNTVNTPLTLNLKTGLNSIEIQRGILPSGVYFIQISGQGILVTKKLVIE